MKYLFLALLSKTPTHGYDLLQTYQSLFASVLPALNAGQIYTTLSRLERDGLVQGHPIQQAGKPDKQVYELTGLGTQALRDWFSAPLSEPRLKDNFYLKLVSARIARQIDPGDLIRDQRAQYLQQLHDLNSLLLLPEASEDPLKTTLIQGAILHLKADLEWLDLCEEFLAREG